MECKPPSEIMLGNKGERPLRSLNAQIKRADLTTGVGALVLGLGLGSLFNDWITGMATVLAAVGGTVHAWGMLDKHGIEKRAAFANPRFTEFLYWVCWLSLAGLAAYYVASVLGSP
jgi:hypothetical protein